MKRILSHIYIVLLCILGNSAFAQSEIQFLNSSFSATTKMQALIETSISDDIVLNDRSFFYPEIRFGCRIGMNGQSVFLLQYKDVKIRLDLPNEEGCLSDDIDPKWISEITINKTQSVNKQYPDIKNPYEVVIVLKKRKYRKLSDDLKKKLHFSD